MEGSIDSESEEVRVYAWRVEQLGKLGISIVIAGAVANVVDWHEVARLVHNGCPARVGARDRPMRKVERPWGA